MAANEKVLGELHTKVATVLIDALDGQEIPMGEQDEDGNERVQRIPPAAAILTAAIQFLKNNDITCAPSEDNALGALKEKQKEREARRAANKLDRAAAVEHTSFMAGLPH